VQLFPGQLWAEPAIGIAIVGLAIALMVTLIARRQAARLVAERPPAGPDHLG
jgi:hypothetical protein